MNCDRKTRRAPLCILPIASITHYYCKMCHYTTQIGRSDIYSPVADLDLKADTVGQPCVIRCLGQYSGRLGLKVLLNALGSCSALNNSSQSVENLSISTLSLRMRNRILDSGRQNQKFRAEKFPLAPICFVSDHVRSSPHGMLCRNIKGNIHISLLRLGRPAATKFDFQTRISNDCSTCCIVITAR